MRIRISPSGAENENSSVSNQRVRPNTINVTMPGGRRRLMQGEMRDPQVSIKQNQEAERLAFWRFISVVGTVAFAGGGVLGNFFRGVVVQMIETLRTLVRKPMPISALPSLPTPFDQAS